MLDWVIEPLGKHHDRTAFACGKPSLDDFLRTMAGQYDKRRFGRTFVAVPAGEVRVIGYFTLSASAIPFDHIPPDAARKLPKHPAPVVLLGRLAVDQSAQGNKLGEGLLLDALQRAVDSSAGLGVHAVEVHALDAGAARFYAKYGFVPLLDDPLHLYLPITTIEETLA